MTKIIEFKPKKKKAPVRRNARRGLSIIDKFKEINKQWHENEKNLCLIGMILKDQKEIIGRKPLEYIELKINY